MKNIHLILAVLTLVSPVATGADEKKPALWAVYYAWYETDAGSRGQWVRESGDGASGSEPLPKSKAAPLIGYYDSDDPAVVRWHVQLAKAAGIDALLVSWWGGANLSGKALEEVILPAAEAENFHVAMCSELAQFHHDVKQLAAQTTDALRRIKDSPAYLRVDGKPVVYLYQVPFAPKLTPDTFAELRERVEAEIGPVYWVMDKVVNPNGAGLHFPEEWLRIPEISMFGFYGTFSIRRVWKYEDLAPDYARLAAEARAAGKRVFLPAHPGHDNSGFRPDDFFIIPRDGGDTLRGYLRAAEEARADVVLLTSFNEWPETTVVEPSSSWPDPYAYLKILAEWKGKTFIQPPLPRITQ